MMTSLYTTLQLQVENLVATVTLDRPAVRNAFNEVLIAELTQVFVHLAERKEVALIVLAANGKSFCAGADLAWMKAMAAFTYDENLADAKLLAEMLELMYRCPKPIIAKVHGDAYGGGVGLAAVCDIVIASEEAHFCLSEARLGLLPGTISPYVIKALGEQACRRYFITSERFSATQAHRLGFVHILSQPSQLDESVDKICQSILQNGPEAVMACKKLVQDYASKPIDRLLIQDSVERIAEIRCSKEAQYRMKLFLEKN
jgi:methylglutaconyl-CoA hydratase